MIKIEIHVEEKKLLGFCADALNEYVKRLGRYAKVKVLLGSKMKGKLERKAGEYVVALRSDGEDISSEGFAQKISTLATEGKSTIYFYIGENNINSDWVLRLSRGTNHQSMEVVMLVEQIYRSFRILHGEPYHK